jgi:hypothetical protein
MPTSTRPLAAAGAVAWLELALELELELALELALELEPHDRLVRQCSLFPTNCVCIDDG